MSQKSSKRRRQAKRLASPTTSPCKSKSCKTAVLAVAMAAALCMGAWLIISPMMEKQKMIDRQNELLESISQGDGVIVLDERFAVDEVDFYSGGADAPVEEAVFLTAVSEPEPAASEQKEIVITGTGVLYIDSIDAELPVTDGVTSAQLKVAVGHVPQTATIGSVGNAVIAGHRSYAYGQFFNRLGEVKEGDLIRYEDMSGVSFTYKVYETLDIVPGDPAAFEQPGRMGEQDAEHPTSPDNDHILTLYTCTPIRTATHRLLVRARLVNQITIEEESN